MSDTQELSDKQKHVLLEKGTEAPHSGALLEMNDKGDYVCAQCGAKIFESSAKYESTTPGLIGWPSFDRAVPGAIKEVEDNSLFMRRTETVCAKCGGHLGHVFAADDSPTGTHYCINSCAMNFKGEDGTVVRGDGN